MVRPLGYGRDARGRKGPPLLTLALLVLLACSVLLPPGAWAAVEAMVVQAEGTATKTEEIGDVKQAAIDQAIRNAVEDALETVVARERLQVDPEKVRARIYDHAVSFVLNFRILSEERFTEEVEVFPEAPEAEEGELPPPPPATEGEEGLLPPEGSIERGEPVIMEVERYVIWIEARVDALQLRNALGGVVTSTPGRISRISLVLLDIPDHETYRSVLSALDRITVIKEISYDSFYPGRFVFSAQPTAGLQDVVGRIAAEAGSDFVVAAAGPHTIVIKAFPKRITLDSMGTER